MEKQTATRQQVSGIAPEMFEGAGSRDLVHTEPDRAYALREKSVFDLFPEYLGSFIRAVPVLTGAFFLFGQSALVFLNYVLKPESTIVQPWKQPFYIIGGFLLLFLGLGKIKRPNDLLLYAFFPLMGITFSLVFNSIPDGWRFSNSFAYSLFALYPFVLFAFFYLKGYLQSDNE